MKINIKKIKSVFIFTFIFCAINICTVFSNPYNWKYDTGEGKWRPYDSYDAIVRDQIICDDNDNDGIAFYYYVDKDGYMLIDTICPDYYIVDDIGRRLDKTGNVQYKDVGIKGDYNSTGKSKLIPELQSQLENTNANQGAYGATSQNTISNVNIFDLYGPQLNIQKEADDGHSKSILGVGAVLKDKSDDYDASVDPTVINYAKNGSQYTKNVNGKTYSGVTWEGAVALKGTGAYFDVENPNNNFNRVSGRISTHYFNSSSSQKNDRTTKCILIVSDQNMDELYYDDSFNYTSSGKFSFIFPRKTKTLRFELQVDGEYTTRTVYIKNLMYGFNKKAWKEEKEEDEVEGYNPLSDIEDEINLDMLEVDDDIDDEVDDDDDDDDDSIDNSVPSDNDKTTGPSFDTSLQENALRNALYGPAFQNTETH